MAKDSALLSELHKLIGQRMEAGQIAQPSEIVEEIFQSKPLTGPHADFYRAFAKKELVGWPAAGFVDTEIRCLTELESWNAETKVQPRVQA